MAVTHAIGRRKTSVARVYVQEGKGNIVINNKALSDYFPSAIMQFKVEQPFTILEEKGNFDVKVNVEGGGLTGQAEAIQLGVARLLCKMNPENRPVLKPFGFLTRDARIKERKKYGLRKARKAPQYSKR